MFSFLCFLLNKELNERFKASELPVDNKDKFVVLFFLLH